MIALCTSYCMVEDLAREHEVKSNLAQIFDFSSLVWFSCCLNLLGAWDCG